LLLLPTSGQTTDTEFCLESFTVANINISYNSVSMSVSIPPLGINQDVSQKVNSKLENKIPNMEQTIETRINEAAMKKLPVCKPFSR